MVKIIYLESTLKHKFIDSLKNKLAYAIKYFPELESKTIYIGIADKHMVKGYADVDNNLVSFRFDSEPKYVTIFHELMHLVQHNGNNPSTEEWNSIYAMAHMPSELIDDCIPYVWHETIPFDVLGDCCREAVKYRENGNRNYIKFLKEKIENIYKVNRQRDYLENMKMLPVELRY